MRQQGSRMKHGPSPTAASLQVTPSARMLSAQGGRSRRHPPHAPLRPHFRTRGREGLSEGHSTNSSQVRLLPRRTELLSLWPCSSVRSEDGARLRRSPRRDPVLPIWREAHMWLGPRDSGSACVPAHHENRENGGAWAGSHQKRRAPLVQGRVTLGGGGV